MAVMCAELEAHRIYLPTIALVYLLHSHYFIRMTHGADIWTFQDSAGQMLLYIV